jgi:formate--tetrahydrofolate ligase
VKLWLFSALLLAIKDLQKRIGDIIIAYKRDKSPIYARDVKADGPMTVLLKERLDA